MNTLLKIEQLINVPQGQFTTPQDVSGFQPNVILLFFSHVATGVRKGSITGDPPFQMCTHLAQLKGNDSKISHSFQVKG